MGGENDTPSPPLDVSTRVKRIEDITPHKEIHLMGSRGDIGIDMVDRSPPLKT